ncbi:cytochrome P [Marssonina coronariae]|uniref:Cytochrome P n=1 Tax=Diplocarpon coronariae TaxID=2795749 RepID=A0A218ZAC6_9HELO|nr:cytochrome P [Marssonina coronariae]
MFTWRDVVSLLASYLLAHIVVLSIYRLNFHPYAKYPGPFLAKITCLYGAYYAYTGGMHLDILRCHKKYGKFVRYRPDGLLVNSPEGFHDIYGNGRKVKKSKSYMVHGQGNLLGIQDKTEYARNKKIFQQGFSDTANREHEHKFIPVINTFVDKISENGIQTYVEGQGGWTEPKNMALWCTYLTTDVVTKVMFTTSWDLLVSPLNRGVLSAVQAIVRLVGTLHYWPHHTYHELTALLFLPHLTWSMKALRQHSIAVMSSSRAAREADPSINDVFAFFSSVRDQESGELALSADAVRRNCANFIIAGSDTTASSLAATFFYLSRDEVAYRKIAGEVRAAFPSAEAVRAGPVLNSCVYLRAALNESLRLSPVAAQPLWREAEPGLSVAGESIAAGLNVAASIFSLHHDESAFPEPAQWDMSRWLADPTKDEHGEKERLRILGRSWAPFSAGPRQCIAKNFALMELMLTMAHVFLQLDFERVGTLGEGKQWEYEMKSYFTSYMEGPMVRFKKREV